MDSTLDKDKYYNVNWLCSKASEMSSQNNNMLVKNTRIYFGWFQFQTTAIIKSPNKKKYSDLDHSQFNQENVSF